MKLLEVSKVPDIKKYLNKEGLENYTERMPHSAEQMQAFVSNWLDEHPEATTTVQDNAVTTPKLHDSAVTEPKLADESVSLRTLAPDVLHTLKGAILTKELTGEMLTTIDAYAVPPINMFVDGKSTQNGTPTPNNPVAIESLEASNLVIHASADGTADATNWPISIQLGQQLCSLPSGAHDTINFTYLRPSSRDGWAWFSRSLVRVVNIVTISSFTSYHGKTRHGSNPGCVFGIAIDAPAVHALGYCSHAAWIIGTTATETYGQFGTAWVTHDNQNLLKIAIAPDRTSLERGNEWLTENGPITFMYELVTPTTETQESIELPKLPAPNFTIWSAPNTGLQLEYMRDSNIVIQRIEEAIADL